MVFVGSSGVDTGGTGEGDGAITLLPLLLTLDMAPPAAIPVMPGDVDIDGAMSMDGGLLLLLLPLFVLGSVLTLFGGDIDMLFPPALELHGESMSSSDGSEGTIVGDVVLGLGVPIVVDTEAEAEVVEEEVEVEGKMRPGAMPVTAPLRPPMLIRGFLCVEGGGGEGDVLMLLVVFVLVSSCVELLLLVVLVVVVGGGGGMLESDKTDVGEGVGGVTLTREDSI